MDFENLQGEWHLLHYRHEIAEIPYEESDDGPRLPEILAWLEGITAGNLVTSDPRTGLHLTFDEDQFEERVEDFAELMFDAEGVQVNDYAGMRGKVAKQKGITFLRPEIPNWLLPPDRRHSFLRYDDGDTMIADVLTRSDEELTRKLSAATDEIYLERMTLIYHQSGAW